MSPIVSKIFNEYSSGELYRKVDPSNSTNEEVERISSLILLCYSYQWETNLTELENICNTIEEIATNKSNPSITHNHNT